MKTLYAVVCLAGLSLGGCCLTVGGCNAPVATAATNWDGLGDPSTEDVPRAPKPLVLTRPRAAKPDRSNAGGSRQADDVSQPSDDDALKRKLIICQGCAVPGN